MDTRELRIQKSQYDLARTPKERADLLKDLMFVKTKTSKLDEEEGHRKKGKIK